MIRCMRCMIAREYSGIRAEEGTENENGGDGQVWDRFLMMPKRA